MNQIDSSHGMSLYSRSVENVAVPAGIDCHPMTESY